MAICLALALHLALELKPNLELDLQLAPWSWPLRLRTIRSEIGDGSCRWLWRAVTTARVWPMGPAQPQRSCLPG